MSSSTWYGEAAQRPVAASADGPVPPIPSPTVPGSEASPSPSPSAAGSTTIDLTSTPARAFRVLPAAAPEPAGEIPEGLDPDGVLRACVRTLVGLAYRTPGFDVSVSSGPDHSWALRLHHAGDGLRAQLLRAVAGTGEGPQVDLTPSPALLEAELATLLWSQDRQPAQN